MGLAEKRATEEIKQKWNEGWQKRIQDAVQSPVPIEVGFDTFVKEGQSGYAVAAFEKIFVMSTENGFKELCKDALGKDAVAGALKKIVIENMDNCSSGNNWVKFEGGTLTLNHKLMNADNIKERADGLVKTLSAAL